MKPLYLLASLALLPGCDLDFGPQADTDPIYCQADTVYVTETDTLYPVIEVPVEVQVYVTDTVYLTDTTHAVDTVYRTEQVPVYLTDTVYQVQEVPVEVQVYVTDTVTQVVQVPTPVEVPVYTPVFVYDTTYLNDTVYVTETDTVYVTEAPVEPATSPVEPAERPGAPATTPNPIGVNDALYGGVGVVYTGAAESIMNAQDPEIKEGATHARYMAIAYRAYDGANEGIPYVEADIKPAFLQGDNVWGNPPESMRANLDRVNKIRKLHPDGVIVLVSEYYKGFEWPGKMPTLTEMFGEERFPYHDGSSSRNPLLNTRTAEDLALSSKGVAGAAVSRGSSDEWRWRSDPRLKDRVESLTKEELAQIEAMSFDFYEAWFQTLEALPGTYVMEATGEWWLRAMLPVTNEWLKGYRRAYDAVQPPNVIPSLGARQMTNRYIDWAGGLLSESIEDVPPSFLEWLNEREGMVSMNLYPAGVERFGFATPEELKGSKDFDELEAMHEYLEIRYPDIDVYLSETGYSSAGNDTPPTLAQLKADRSRVDYLLERTKPFIVWPFYYQIETHWPQPEGKFSPLDFLMDLDHWKGINDKY